MRAAVALILLLAALGALAVGCGGDDGGDDLVSVQFVQTAQGGGFTVDGERVTLTLRPVSFVTTTFTDRPERDAGAIDTEEFAARFDAAFADDPPNATVSSLDAGVGEFTVELSRPRYDADRQALTYAVEPRGGLQIADLPARLGPVSVFIDGVRVDSGSVTVPDGS